MKKTLLTLLTAATILTPACAPAADYALAYRPGIAVTETPWPKLEKSVFDGAAFWGNGHMNGSSMTDFSPERTDAVIQGPCLDFNGVGDELTFSGIPAGATVTNQGTAELSITSDTVNATAGTAWDIKIYDGATLWSHLPAQEGSGLTAHDVSGNGNHGTIANVSGTVWDGTQTSSPYAAEYGASRVMSFNGTTAKATFGDEPFRVGTNDFSVTVEFFIPAGFLAASNLEYTLIGKGDNGGKCYWIYVRPGGMGAVYWLFDDGTTQQFVLKPLSSSIENRWITAEFSKTGTNISINVHGDTVASGAMTLTDFDNTLNLAAGGSEGIKATKAYIGTMIRSVDFQSPTTTASYTAANAYGTTLPDNVGTNNATLVNVEFVDIPALADGSDDAEGLGITNPKGLGHGNQGYSLIFGGATNSFATLLTNTTDNITSIVNDAGLISELYEVTP